MLGFSGLAACTGARPLSPEDGRAYEVSVAWIAGQPSVAWYGGRQAHEAIYLRRADARGRPRGPALQLTDARVDAFEPSLQAIEGEALVAWYEQHPDRRQVARIARFDADGQVRWQRQLSAEGTNGRIPVVRTAGAIAHVAWVEQREGAVPLLRAASLDAQGNWLSGPRDLVPVGRETWNLNAAIAPDGAFHIVFDAARAGAKELHAIRVADGNFQETLPGPDDGQDSVYPDIAFDARRVALTWFDHRDGNAEIYLRCTELDSAGLLPATPAGESPILRVTHTPAESIGAYVTWQAGQVVLAWIETGGAGQGLWLQRFDRDCQPLGRARRLAGEGGLAGVPSLAARGPDLALAWNLRVGSARSLAGQAHSREPSSVVYLDLRW